MAKRKVSKTCEVIRLFDPLFYCGEPTTHWYPAVGGTMALCAEHAKPHKTATPINPLPALSRDDPRDDTN